MHEIAQKRANQNWLSLARIVAIGTSAGFSGSTKAIDRLAQNLQLPHGTTTGQVVRDRLKKVYDEMTKKRGTR